jgi:hypothetical protein
LAGRGVLDRRRSASNVDRVRVRFDVRRATSAKKHLRNPPPRLPPNPHLVELIMRPPETTAFCRSWGRRLCVFLGVPVLKLPSETAPEERTRLPRSSRPDRWPYASLRASHASCPVPAATLSPLSAAPMSEEIWPSAISSCAPKFRLPHRCKRPEHEGLAVCNVSSSLAHALRHADSC